MNDNHRNSGYPRALSPREREWVEWILPVDRPGYGEFREIINSMSIIGEGRRGKGEIVLGKSGDAPDFSEPFGSVFAYGAIETNFGMISITIREMVNDQISLEIVSHRFDEVPKEFEESRRWTYSTWNPGQPCPQCLKPLREVSMHTPAGKHLILAMCTNNKRLWAFDKESRVNRLIPVTNFYNELMLHKNIRDPKVALDGKQLFVDLEEYSDEDLTYAFFTYNKIRTKFHIDDKLEADYKKKQSLLKRLSHTLKLSK